MKTYLKFLAFILLIISSTLKAQMAPHEIFNQIAHYRNELSVKIMDYQITSVHEPTRVDEKIKALTDLIIEAISQKKQWDKDEALSQVASHYTLFLEHLKENTLSQPFFDSIPILELIESRKATKLSLLRTTNLLNRLDKTMHDFSIENELVITSTPQNEQEEATMDRMNAAFSFKNDLTIFKVSIIRHLNFYSENLNENNCEQCVNDLNGLKQCLRDIEGSLENFLKAETDEERQLVAQLKRVLALTKAFSIRNIPQSIAICWKESRDEATNEDIELLNEQIDAFNTILLKNWNELSTELKAYMVRNVPRVLPQ